MKKSLKSLPLILTAGVAGVALFILAQSQFIAALPGDKLIAIAASVAIVAFATADYTRRVQPLTPPRGQVLRPRLPVGNTPQANTRKDRIAA
jgi:hypothetical protein